MKCVYCHCAYTQIIPQATRDAAVAAIGGRDDVLAVSDLCEMAARRDPRLAEISRASASGDGAVTIAACYPRAVTGLFNAAEVPLTISGVEFINMRIQPPHAVAAALGRGGRTLPLASSRVTEESAETVPGRRDEGSRESADRSDLSATGSWKPWFPVIDPARCTNCMQCLSFCLFDVYGVRDGRISVQNPANCKTDCPACSRVCPEAAIMFPKYKAGPINGEEVGAGDSREKVKVDISALLGGDVYSLLRRRNTDAKARFARERDEGQALRERLRCLAKLKEELGLTDEMLSSLPSMEQIAAKAASAQASARAPAGEGE